MYLKKRMINERGRLKGCRSKKRSLYFFKCLLHPERKNSAIWIIHFLFVALQKERHWIFLTSFFFLTFIHLLLSLSLLHLLFFLRPPLSLSLLFFTPYLPLSLIRQSHLFFFYFIFFTIPLSDNSPPLSTFPFPFLPSRHPLSFVALSLMFIYLRHFSFSFSLDTLFSTFTTLLLTSLSLFFALFLSHTQLVITSAFFLFFFPFSSFLFSSFSIFFLSFFLSFNFRLFPFISTSTFLNPLNDSMKVNLLTHYFLLPQISFHCLFLSIYQSASLRSSNFFNFFFFLNISLRKQLRSRFHCMLLCN